MLEKFTDAWANAIYTGFLNPGEVCAMMAQVSRDEMFCELLGSTQNIGTGPFTYNGIKIYTTPDLNPGEILFFNVAVSKGKPACTHNLLDRDIDRNENQYCTICGEITKTAGELYGNE